MENTLSKKDAVLLLCRLMALYLIFWALSDALSLPGELNSLLHHLSERSELPASVLIGDTHAGKVESYWLRYYLLVFCINFSRIVIFLFAAAWFYRCGPRIQKFFGVSRNEEAQSTPASVAKD